MLFSYGPLAGPVYDIASYSTNFTPKTSELVQKQKLIELNAILDSVKTGDIGKEVNSGNIDETLARFFELKRTIRVTDDAMSADLVSMKKVVLMKIRLFEELISEKFYFQRNPTFKKKEVINAFEGDGLFNQGIETRVNSLDSLKSGDVILIRGATTISASVARFSEFPMMHSHIAIVYVDPKTKEKFLVESITKRGLQAEPFKVAFSKQMPRISVYRSKNVVEAEAAARLAYEMANFSVKNNYGFGFDYSMDLISGYPKVKKINQENSMYSFDPKDLENCRFFCSKLVSFVYNKEDSTSAMPRFPSRLRPSMYTLVDAMGASRDVKESFFPGDIEFEPGFELVHEYKNPTATLEIRIEDAVVDDVYSRISVGEKEIRIRGIPRFVINIVHGVVSSKPVRFLLKKLGVVIDPNVKAEVMDTLFALDKIIKAVKTELKLKDKKGLIVLKDLTFDELTKHVKYEIDTNDKVKKVLIDHVSTAQNQCARFYSH